MRISDWSSDVCSSDLSRQGRQRRGAGRAVGQKRARCARALIRRCAPPSPAAQEKGWCGWRGGSDESPSPAAQAKGWFKLRGESCKPFSRLREKVPDGRMRGRERSEEIGRASRRERVCQYVSISVVAV